ncbi:MAG: XrtA/PEP-CTERM system exopolysaccharide export protein, partial [Pseudomonadota bacterium]
MNHLATNTMAFLLCLLLFGCGGAPTLPPVGDLSERNTVRDDQSNYRIGPGDQLQIFVWRNPEISTTVPVRPDGRISTPLVEDMLAVGKTPTELARAMEEVLAVYIKEPQVNVIVNEFEGVPTEQIRVVGQAANPQTIAYREGMTVLDVVIAAGGLGEFAAGNRSKLVRKVDDRTIEYKVRLNDLINK